MSATESIAATPPVATPLAAEADGAPNAAACDGSSTDSDSGCPGRWILAMPRCVGSTSANSEYVIRGCASSAHGELR